MTITKVASLMQKLNVTGFFSSLPRNTPNLARNYSVSNVMKVTLVGAEGNIGQSLALMLKQCAFIDELCLYDTKPLHAFVKDLNFVDTRCKVFSFNGKKELKKALENSNVIVVLASAASSESLGDKAQLDKNAPIVKEVITDIATTCPRALIAIATEPINSIVPMASEILKKIGHYNPYAVFGITTLDVVRANKFVAEVQGVVPECVVVPVIGGHSEMTIVPVLSQATPCAEFTNEELEDITTSVRQARDNLIRVRACDGICLSAAFAAARFVVSLVKGLRGHPDVVECAYVKSVAHPRLTYMAAPLVLGPGGVMKNLGVPKLSDYESCLLENAILLLAEDIKLGEEYGGKKDRAVCDVCDPDPKAPRCPPDHCAITSIMTGDK